MQSPAERRRMAFLASKDKFHYSTVNSHNGHDYTRKSFIDEDGDLEELYDFEGTKGYGNGYSHPKHLNEMVNEGEKIKNFKGMDRVIDEHILLRVIDEKHGGRTLSTGTKVSPEQLGIIEGNFEEGKRLGIPIRAKITSNSRKKFSTFAGFQNELHKQSMKKDNRISSSDVHLPKGLSSQDAQDQRDFNSHIGKLSENE